MNSQDLFAKRIAENLDASLDAIPQHIEARLNQAREKALESAREQRAHVGQGVLALRWAGTRQRMAMLILATLMGLGAIGAQYNRIQAVADEAADIDEQILSDDAPVQSYMDPGFAAAFRSGLISRLGANQTDSK